MSSAATGFKSISVADASVAVSTGTRYLDVRTVEEYDAGHVPGAVDVPNFNKSGGALVPNPAFLEQVLLRELGMGRLDGRLTEQPLGHQPDADARESVPCWYGCRWREAAGWRAGRALPHNDVCSPSTAAAAAAGRWRASCRTSLSRWWWGARAASAVRWLAS